MRLRFRGLIFGRAYFWGGLIVGILRYSPTKQFDAANSHLQLRLEVFQFTLLGQPDAVINFIYADIQAICVQVL